MIYPTRILLMAAFGLIMTAIVSPAADIPITYLPYTITAPGTYVLAQDLTYSDPNTPAISIETPDPQVGAIVIDLRGHTLSGFTTQSNTTGILDDVSFGRGPTTIKNGAIQNYTTLVLVQNGAYDPLDPVGVVLDHLTFNDAALHDPNVGEAVGFGRMNNSTVRDCAFTSCHYGIYDADSGGGNRYVNNTFSDCSVTIQVNLYGPVTGVIKDCVFAPYVPQQAP